MIYVCMYNYYAQTAFSICQGCIEGVFCPPGIYFKQKMKEKKYVGRFLLFNQSQR